MGSFPRQAGGCSAVVWGDLGEAQAVPGSAGPCWPHSGCEAEPSLPCVNSFLLGMTGLSSRHR